ncbi:MAG: Adenylate kinase 7, variant 2 [Marteilia pararefringens]
MVTGRIFLNNPHCYEGKYIVQKLREGENEQEAGQNHDLEIHTFASEVKTQNNDAKIDYSYIKSTDSVKGDAELLVNKGDLNFDTFIFIIGSLSTTNKDIELFKSFAEALLLNSKSENENEERKLREINLVVTTNIGTWSRTKQNTEENRDNLLSDYDYRKRKANKTFKSLYECECLALKLSKRFKEINCVILCPGITYGREQLALNYIFRQAWLCEKRVRIFGQGENRLPLVHVEDFASAVKIVLENIEKIAEDQPYLLVTEETILTYSEIVQLICSVFASGSFNCVVEQNCIESQPHDYLEEVDTNLLQIDVELEALYLKDDLDGHRKYSGTFKDNIGEICGEYSEARGLGQIKLIILGPPGSGKSYLAKKLASHYKLPIINRNEVIERWVHRMRSRVSQSTNSNSISKKSVENIELENNFSQLITDEEDTSEILQLLDLVDESLSQNGRIYEHLETRFLRERLAIQDVANKGYILDITFDSLEEVKNIFMEDSDELSYNPQIMPQFVIFLNADDEYLIKRMSQVSGELQTYSEEQFNTALAKYRILEEKEEILDFFGENGCSIEHLDASTSDFDMQLERLKLLIGMPQNFGLAKEEKCKKEKIEKESKEKKEREHLEALKLQEIYNQRIAEKRDIEYVFFNILFYLIGRYF